MRQKDFNILVSEPNNNPARDILYDFSQAYQRNSNTAHIFEDGTKMTTIEAHTLKHICQHNGVTLTDIVNYWGRTKGTVSAQITNLENKGYVRREKCKNDNKKVHIFPTELGLKINEEHRNFDLKETAEFIDKWLDKYTAEDMMKFIEYMQFYIDVAFAEKK